MSQPGSQTQEVAGYAMRLERLRHCLRRLGSVVVAYSGGVDSTVLLHVATSELGGAATGVIADSPSLPRRELQEALAGARQAGLDVTVLGTDEGENPAYRANRGDRCYHCKSALFAAMRPWAEARGIRSLAFGEIAEDRLEDRPGSKAAQEFQVVAPLSLAGFSKADVRRYARESGLAVWQKPAAACLASRIPVGTQVTPQRLARVEAAEERIRLLGFAILRVRHHGERALVEIGPQEMERAMQLRPALLAAVQAAGFTAMDLDLYRSPTEKRQPAAVSQVKREAQRDPV